MPKPPANRYRAFEVVLDDRFQRPLSVRRAPQFARFTVKGDDWTTLDMLDQFEDTAGADERIIVAEKGETNPCHYHYTGKLKHLSGWYLWVKYTILPDQPPDSAVRATEAWREWCRAKWEERRVKSSSAVPEVPSG